MYDSVEDLKPKKKPEDILSLLKLQGLFPKAKSLPGHFTPELANLKSKLEASMAFGFSLSVIFYHFIETALQFHKNQEPLDFLSVIKANPLSRGGLLQSLMQSIREKHEDAIIEAEVIQDDVDEPVRLSFDDLASSPSANRTLSDHIHCANVLKKRRAKMRRHKHKKRLKANRYKSKK